MTSTSIVGTSREYTSVFAVSLSMSALRLRFWTRMVMIT